MSESENLGNLNIIPFKVVFVYFVVSIGLKTVLDLLLGQTCRLW